MAQFEKTPVYIDDTPVEYDSFTGGINNDTDNENIMNHELRDAVNTNYKNGNLERRPGADLIKNIKYLERNPDEHKNVVQGSFTYVGRHNHYIIIVRDGFVYYNRFGEGPDLNMIELDILIDTSRTAYDPLNLAIGLDIFNPGEHPSFLHDHDGFIIRDVENISEDSETMEDLWGDDNGEKEYHSAILRPGMERLVLQNYKKVQGAAFDNKMYLATGTRYLVLEEVEMDGEVMLEASVVEPRKVNAFHYEEVGGNYLSPFPSQYVKSSYRMKTSMISFIHCNEHTLHLRELVNADHQTYYKGSATFKALLHYIQGTDANDYNFRWEYKLYPNGDESEDHTWVRMNNIKDGLGMNTTTLSVDDGFAHPIMPGDTLEVRCTYATEFETENVDILDEAGEVTGTEERFVTNDHGDYIIDRINSSDHGSYSITYKVLEGTFADYKPSPAPEFLDIHACNKMFTDGNQIILYGSSLKSGNWYKTIKDSFDYITQRNSLNFQTNKNERIVAALPLEGNIIVFADNEHLGGSIHKVWGNGDDYDAGDGYYSPYKRSIVNTSVSCDHPGSVQFVQNFLIFKYKREIFMIDSRELNAERLNVTSLSDKISHHQPGVEIPDIPYGSRYEFKVLSEITDSYYGIIFPEYNLRWKLYYKMPFNYQGQAKTFYPWLRDETEILQVDNILVIRGTPTHVYNDRLIQYTNKLATDLGETFKTRFLTKAYPISPIRGTVKFVNSVLFKFFRGSTDVLSLDFKLYNEANRLLVGQKFESFYDESSDQVVWDDPHAYFAEVTEEDDRPSWILGQTNLNTARLGSHLYSSKVYRPDLRFPCLSAYAMITIDSKEAFALSSITFDYENTDLPQKSLPQLYASIWRKGD